MTHEPCEMVNGTLHCKLPRNHSGRCDFFGEDPRPTPGVPFVEKWERGKKVEQFSRETQTAVAEQSDAETEAKYATLRAVLERAYEQAAHGKGKERHANGEAFENQLIVKIGQYMGNTTGFNIGQACKKSIESTRLPKERAIAELLGAINYLAGAVIILEAEDAK